MTPEIPPPPPIPREDRLANEIRSAIVKVIAGVAVAVLGAVVVGGVAQYAMLEARAAETTQRFVDAERRLGALEERFEDVQDLQRDVTALSTKVDAWRQSDTAARAVERELWERRMTRFERLIGGARGGQSH